MMMKKMLVLLLAALILLLSSCIDTYSRQEITLRIGILPDVDSIPLVIAEQKGFYKAAGVTIVLERFTSAQERDGALQSGKIDGAVSDILAASFALEGGFDVAVTSCTNGSYKLLAAADTKAAAVPDLYGMEIAVSKNTVIEYTLDRLLQERGMKAADVEKVVIPQIPVRLEMLQQGKVDGVVLPEPLASVAVRNGAVLLDSTENLGINPGVLIFTRKAITEKEAAIRVMYTGYNAAVEYLQKEESSGDMLELIEMAGFPEAVREVLSLPQYHAAGLPPEEEFVQVSAWLKEKALTQSTYTMESMVDDRFVQP